MKSKSVAQIKRKLDKLFSIWIRNRGVTWKGENVCFTCKKRAHWKTLQAGHFVARWDNNLRYDEENVHVQCMQCNVLKRGNMVVYAIEMRKKYGKGIIEKLYKRSQEPKNWKISELEDLIKKYK